MQDRKRKSFEGIMATLVLMVAFTAGSLFAGGERRLEGTVKSIGSDSVVIETAAHKLQAVKITSATKFFKNHQPSSLSEMKNGAHVVFKVVPTSSADTALATTPSANTSSTSTSVGDLTCTTSASGTTTTCQGETGQDSITLGLSFCATQVSY